MLLAIIPVIPVFIKINHYKRFGLIIQLKDGTIFRKKVTLKLKSENIDFVNAIKKACNTKNLIKEKNLVQLFIQTHKIAM